jgi:hypothetical protein
VWAEWNDQQGIWTLLPQGSFKVNACVTGGYPSAGGCYTP